MDSLTIGKVMDMVKVLKEKGYQMAEILNFPTTCGEVDTKNFIQVNEKFGNVKVLLPIDKILSLSEQKDGSCFVETGLDRNGESLGLFVSESYADVVKQLSSVKKII